jgi:beta-lactamase class A
MLPLLFFFFAATDFAATDLGGQFAEIARDAQGKTGAAAIVLETGERASFHGADRFPMQSVYKFPIAMAALQLVDTGKLSLEQAVTVAKSELAPPALHSPIRDQHPEGVSLSVRELVRYAIAESDGTASDVLLRLVGGPAAVTRYLGELGVKQVAVATTEAEMASGPMVQYRNWATPDGMLVLLAAFQAGRGLSPASHQLLDDFMAASTPGLKRIKGLLPAGTRVAHKTGTSGTEGNLTRATNDVGIVALPNGHHLAIAVFVSDSTAPQDARELVIARIARAAWDRFAGN